MKIHSFFSPKGKEKVDNIVPAKNDSASGEPPSKKLKKDDQSSESTSEHSSSERDKLNNCICITDSSNKSHNSDSSLSKNETSICNDEDKTEEIICISDTSSDVPEETNKDSLKTSFAEDTVVDETKFEVIDSNKDTSKEKSEDESKDHSDTKEKSEDESKDHSDSNARANSSSSSIEDTNQNLASPGEKDKINPPKQKRRKLTKEEKDAREQQKQAAKEAKEKEKEEKEKERKEKQEEKDRKEKERIAKKEQFEKEKQVKKEQQEKERLEREKLKDEEKRKKQEALQAKEEERKKREEERLKKEEERLKKEDERKRKEEEIRQKEEEEERKKEKMRSAFKSFFIKKKAPSPKKGVVPLFEPFELKPNMTLAPITRAVFGDSARELIDNCLDKQTDVFLYLENMKNRTDECRIIKYVTRRSLRKTLEQKQEMEKNDDDVIVLDEDSQDREVVDSRNVMKVKFLQFRDNNRPPYYGTWRKKSKHISPKNPLKQDKDLLDYEVDSDDEWEEEEPGESLSGPEDDEEEGDNKENVEEDEDDDGFFVPHGYLSDDEGIQDSDEEGTGTVHIKDRKLDTMDNYPFAKDNKSKALKAFSIGCSWCNTRDQVHNVFRKYQILPLMSLPIGILELECEVDVGCTKSKGAPGGLPMSVPEEAMPMLIKHVHGNSMGINRLIQSFLEQWKECSLPEKPHISKLQLKIKIQSIARRDGNPSSNKSCYLVNQNILEQYGISVEGVEINEERITDSICTPNKMESHCDLDSSINLASCSNLEPMEVRNQDDVKDDKICSGFVHTDNVGDADCIGVTTMNNKRSPTQKVAKPDENNWPETNCSATKQNIDDPKVLQISKENSEDVHECNSMESTTERNFVSGDVVENDIECMEGIEPLVTQPITSEPITEVMETDSLVETKGTIDLQ